jgi:hypothetical protein
LTQRGFVLLARHAYGRTTFRAACYVWLAEPAGLRARIIAREPEGWFGLEFLLDEMQRLHATMPSMEGVHVVLDTEDLSVQQITESIRAARPAVLTANE